MVSESSAREAPGRDGQVSSRPPHSNRPLDEDGTRLLRIYGVALMTRAVDERLWIQSRQGRAGFVLTGRGHEVAQVASAAALRQGHDSAWPYYRDLGVGLALGVSPYEVFLGALARADDPHSGGRQLTAHFSSPTLRIGSISSEVAAHVPHAVGAAYAARVRGDDAVAVCWFGDGAASEGATHEAMNLAGVHRLPVVFICENNGWAISVPTRLQMPIESVAERARGYGMPGATIDGSDAQAVFEASREAVVRARSGGGPSLLEFRVVRMTPHSSQDDDSYRTSGELEAAVRADPLPRLQATLISRGVLTAPSADRLRTSIAASVLQDQERALQQPDPDPSRAQRWLYAGDPPHPSRIQPDGQPLAAGVFRE
jgi:2-oxoisovalerate dehydrogenase E1 component alpha subunit